MPTGNTGRVEMLSQFPGIDAKLIEREREH